MTNEQLQAENERLGAEVAALRALLAAVRDLADVPPAADPTIDADWNAYLALSASRLGSISVWADPASADTLHNSAEVLRALAGQPLRYTPRDEAWRLTAKGVEVADAQAVVVDLSKCLAKYEHLGSTDFCQRDEGHDGQHVGRQNRRWTPAQKASQ